MAFPRSEQLIPRRDALLLEGVRCERARACQTIPLYVAVILLHMAMPGNLDRRDAHILRLGDLADAVEAATETSSISPAATLREAGQRSSECLPEACSRNLQTSHVYTTTTVIAAKISRHVNDCQQVAYKAPILRLDAAREGTATLLFRDQADMPTPPLEFQGDEERLIHHNPCLPLSLEDLQPEDEDMP